MITLSEAKAMVGFAQDYLGLNEWVIYCRLVSQKELQKLLYGNQQVYATEIYGLIVIHDQFKTAELLIWDKLDESPYSHGLAHTIFHELLHIILKPLDSTYEFVSSLISSNQEMCRWAWEYFEEMIINQLATSITLSMGLYEYQLASDCSEEVESEQDPAQET